MFEEILKAVDKKAKEEVTLTKGLALIMIAGAFLVGMIIGDICGTGHTKKKLMKNAPSEDDFDADEYVKSLSFEEE